MTPKPTHPRPQHVGRVRLCVARGPREGRWYWRAQVREAGRYREVWCGWADEETAVREVAALVAQHGLHVPPGRVDTVADLLGYWKGHQRARTDIRERTRADATHLARRLRQELGAIRCDRLDRATLEAYRDRQIRAGMAPRTVAWHLSVLGAAWRYGRSVGLVEGDYPAIRVRVEDRAPKVTPTPGQVAAVLDHLHGWRGTLARLLFATGARIGELAQLRWEDVDLEDGLVSLEGKTGPRTVPLPCGALEELAALPRSGTYVLGVQPRTAALGFRVALRAACDAAGVPRWTPHGFRRLATDTLYRSGVDVGTAAAYLGHSPQVALRYYRQASAEDLRAAVGKARLGVLPEGKVVALTVAVTSGRKGHRTDDPDNTR